MHLNDIPCTGFLTLGDHTRSRYSLRGVQKSLFSPLKEGLVYSLKESLWAAIADVWPISLYLAQSMSPLEHFFSVS